MPNSIHLIKVRCLLFLIMSVLVPAAFSSNVARAQQDLQKNVLDLKSQILDLKFETEDLKGATQGLEIQETETEIKVELSGDVLFDFDKWDIRPEAEPVLQKVAGVIKQYPDAGVLIVGYTDSKGSDSYNLKLSERRAASVKDWLIEKGGVKGNITTKGLGEADPVASNENADGSDNPEGRQKNRRVEITVKK